MDPPGTSHLTLGAPDPGFLADVRASWGAIARLRVLLLMSIIVWSVPTLAPPAFATLVLPLQVFQFGYPGVERLWLLRTMRGEPFDFDQAFVRTWGYIGRFFRLGLLIGLSQAPSSSC